MVVQVDMRKADVSGAKLQECRLQRADLADCTLANTQLQGAHLEGANLAGANLQYANLEGACLRGASLEGANVGAAQFMGADLCATPLCPSQIRRIILSGALSDYLWWLLLRRRGACLLRLSGAASNQGTNWAGVLLEGALVDDATHTALAGILATQKNPQYKSQMKGVACISLEGK